MTFIIYGNPFDGMSIVGPFDDAEAAATYAEACRNIRDETWWSIDPEEPDPELLA